MSNQKQNIDWSTVPFGYSKTAYNIRAYYKNGRWSELEKSEEETIPVHIAATALHYGQDA